MCETEIDVAEAIASFIEKHNGDGTECSADRAVLAARVRRGDWR